VEENEAIGLWHNKGLGGGRRRHGGGWRGLTLGLLDLLFQVVQEATELGEARRSGQECRRSDAE
jgi:hypothetical protein